MLSSGEVPDLYRDDPAKQPPERRRLTVLSRLFPLLRPHRARIAFALFALAGASSASLVYPWAAKQVVDTGLGGQTGYALDRILLGISIVFVLNAVFVWWRHYNLSWLGERVVADLRGLVFDRVLTLPIGWFHDRRSGELVGRLASDVTIVEGIVSSDLSMALRNGIQIIGAIVMLFVIDVKLTLVTFAIVPPIVVTTIYFGRRMRTMSRVIPDQLAHVSGQVQESIGAIATVQAFVREPYEAERYRSGIENAFQKTLTLVRYRSWFWSSSMAAGYIGIAAVIYLGGHALIDKRLTAGALTQFFLYTFMVAGTLSDLSSLWGSLQRAAGATDRLFALIDTVPDIQEPAAPTMLPAGGGAVKFTDVSFAYPSRKAQPVLTNVSIDIKPGEVVALVGTSGAGKSTLLSLLYRFYDVDAGSVTLEGVDVRELPLKELRGALAMVAQEPVLFSGSISDNISYGRDGATREEIEQAARDAYAHDFITGFPDGYNTMIGERGTKLSGGQKQRVALARALLANPRVLILDEATSNLDAESEAAVQAALARLMKGRTTLIVAHRLSTVRDADRIVILDGARIAEHGRHDELMAKKGVYRRLVERQLISFEPDPGRAAS
ncbi:ABC transporter ATP-binding protein [soil metagenome]